jgi:hypothetical protein
LRIGDCGFHDYAGLLWIDPWFLTKTLFTAPLRGATLNLAGFPRVALRFTLGYFHSLPPGVADDWHTSFNNLGSR